MSATTDPIPVRALNQVTYCPRLYYLQYVDASMPTNEHVEGGLHDHRRVDDPDLKNKTRKDGGTGHQSRRRAVERGARHHRRARPDRGEGRRAVPGGDEARPGPARRRRHARPSGTTTRCNCAPRRCSWRRRSGGRCRAGSSSTPAAASGCAVEFTDALRQKTRDAIARCRELPALDAPAGPAAGRTAAPLLRLLARPGVPAGGDAVPDRSPHAGRCGGARSRSRSCTRVIPQSDDGAVLYLQEPGSLRRQAERAPGRPEGRQGDGPRAAARGAAGGGVRQRAGHHAGAGDAGRERDPACRT